METCYKNEHEKLMKKWKEKHNANENGFVKDGIVSPEVWFNIPQGEERILFLLKEAYSKENAKLIWDETKWLTHEKCTEECTEACKKTCSKKEKCNKSDCDKDCKKCKITGNTFNPMAEWVYGINLANKGKPAVHDEWFGKPKKEYKSARNEQLSRIAVVNIRKSGGEKKSNNKVLSDYTKWDKNELMKQIELINPTMIICGGTYIFLRILYPELEEFENSSNGRTMLGDIKIIATCHPNSRKNKKIKFKAIIDNYSLFKKGK